MSSADDSFADLWGSAAAGEGIKVVPSTTRRRTATWTAPPTTPNQTPELTMLRAPYGHGLTSSSSTNRPASVGQQMFRQALAPAPAPFAPYSVAEFDPFSGHQVSAAATPAPAVLAHLVNAFGPAPPPSAADRESLTVSPEPRLSTSALSLRSRSSLRRSSIPTAFVEDDARSVTLMSEPRSPSSPELTDFRPGFAFSDVETGTTLLLQSLIDAKQSFASAEELQHAKQFDDAYEGFRQSVKLLMQAKELQESLDQIDPTPPELSETSEASDGGVNRPSDHEDFQLFSNRTGVSLKQQQSMDKLSQMTVDELFALGVAGAEICEREAQRATGSEKRPAKATDGVAFTPATFSDRSRRGSRNLLRQMSVNTARTFGDLTDFLAAVTDEAEASCEATMAAAEPQDKARAVREEIMAAEVRYVDKLRTVLKISEELIDAPHVLSPDEHSTIFNNAALLVDLHNRLLADLQARQAGELPKLMTFSINGQVQRSSSQAATDQMADVFLHYLPLFKIYVPYLTYFGAASDVLARLESDNRAFAARLATCLQSHGVVGNFASLLIAPVQQLPKYRLLIERLSGAVGATHLDFANLKLAEEAMRGIATEVNESVRREQARLMMAAVEKAFYPRQHFAQANRYFLREGDLTKISDKHGDEQRYHFFLFSESLAYGTPVFRGLYKFHRLVKVLDYEDSHGSHHRFKIFGDVRSLVLQADSAEEKAAWLADLDKVVKIFRTTQTTGHSTTEAVAAARQTRQAQLHNRANRRRSSLFF